jgi:hypothetical protein
MVVPIMTTSSQRENLRYNGHFIGALVGTKDITKLMES